MTELKIIEITLAILAVVSLGELIMIRKIINTADEDRGILLILAKDKMKKEMGNMVENMKQGLENLFNPKDEPKNNVKKTRTNRKTK